MVLSSLFFAGQHFFLSKPNCCFLVSINIVGNTGRLPGITSASFADTYIGFVTKQGVCGMGCIKGLCDAADEKALHKQTQGKEMFMSLYNKVIDLQKLFAAWQRVRRNKPAAGVDNVTWEQFDENSREEL